MVIHTLYKKWPIEFIESINVGADLSRVWPEFCIYLLRDKNQCSTFTMSCIIVAEAYENKLNDKKVCWEDILYEVGREARGFDGRAYKYLAYSTIIKAINYYHPHLNYNDYDSYIAGSCSDAAECAAYFMSFDSDDSLNSEERNERYLEIRQLAYIKQSENLLKLLRECK